MFNIGFTEMLILGVLALILIGPKQLPEVARVVGRMLNELKRSANSITEEFKKSASNEFTKNNKIHTPDTLIVDPSTLPTAESEKKMSNPEVENADPQNQTLVDHLVELKVRIVRSLWAILIGMVICYNFTSVIFDLIRMPIEPYLQGGGLVFTAPMDKFIAHIKLAFFGGLILVFPFVAFQLWKFIAPGLYDKEKKFAVGFVISGTIMFLIGILFTYFIVFPMAFKFLMTYGGDTDKPMISITEYLSFFVTTAIAFGAAFEMPVIIVILGMMGVVSKKFLVEKRRYAFMIIAVLSAVITPPDPLSMLIMLAPLCLLYEVAILLVGIFEKKRIESVE